MTKQTIDTKISSSGHISIKEAAEYLGVSERTIKRAIADKRLGHLKVGRRVCIPAADLRAFINACRGI